MNEKELLAKIRELTEEWRSIASAAAKAGEGLTAEDQEKLDKVKVERSKYNGLLQEAQALREADDGLALASRSEERAGRKTTPEGSAGNGVGGEEKRLYVDDFDQYILRGLKGEQSTIEKRDWSDVSQTIGTVGDGGYLAPDEYMAEIMKKATQINIMRSLATVKQTNRGTWKTFVKLTNPTAVQKDELVTFALGVMTWEEFEIDVHKMTLTIPISHELENDSMFNMRSEIAEAIAEAMDDLGGAWYVTGNGTKQAFGIVTGSILGETAAAADAITVDETKLMTHAVAPKWRNGPKVGFLCNDDTWALLSLLKDGIQHYFVQPDVRDATAEVLHGRRIYIDDNMPAPTAGLKPLLFGDFSQYIIADRQTFMQIDPFSESRQGVVLVNAFVRTGGKLKPIDAVAHLIMHA